MKALFIVSVLGLAIALVSVIKVQYEWWRMRNPKRIRIPELIDWELSNDSTLDEYVKAKLDAR